MTLLILLLLASSSNLRQSFRQIFSRFSNVKVLGAEFTLTEEKVRNLGFELNEVFTHYRDQSKDEFTRLANAYNIDAKIETIAINVFEWGKNEYKIDFSQANFRFTVHVPDILVNNSLYQLVPYYPMGGGRGKTKSVRYGIIGKAFRSHELDKKDELDNKDVTILVKEWGFTKEEAYASQNRPNWLMALSLCTTEDGAVGVFFCDAIKPKSSIDISELKSGESLDTILGESLPEKIKAQVKDVGLTNAVRKLNGEMSKFKTKIKIFDE